jgi:tRNA G18 (ribose-2'-O)-methylase SpoU
MPIVVIAHNIRSTHNVGSIFRTCDGFGVEKLILTGYTPYPAIKNDQRLPHLRDKLTAQIAKTALGAQDTVPFLQTTDPTSIINSYRQNGYLIMALEQTPKAILLPDYKSKTDKIMLILGEEVHGIPPELLQLCDVAIEIPMHGHKESFNVSVAAGIALYAIKNAKK